MKKFTSEEIKEFVSKPLFDEKILLNRDPSWLKISIVTPSYNQRQFLERTILSVLNQNYPNLEYIVIDGGSTDGSVEIIKKYEKYLAYWVSEPDKGQADAINKGFSKSTGEILAWINSDDIYLPNALCKVALCFKRKPHIDVVYGNRYRIDENDNVFDEDRQTPFSKSGLLYGGFGFYQVSVFWKRDIFHEVKGLEIKYKCCMDYDLFVKFAINNAKFKFIREFLGCFRIHGASKTSNLKEIFKAESEQIRNSFIVQNDTIKFLNRSLVRVKRLFHYFLQGDIEYIIKKMWSKT